MNPAMRNHSEQGFTLIELMVVVIVAAILATAAVPAYRSFITSQRIKTASFDMMALLIFTRSEALKANALVTLNSNGAAFNNGSAFTVTSAGGTVLRQQAMFTGIQISCVDMSVSPHAYTACPSTGVVYNGYGRLNTPFTSLELQPLNATDVTQSFYRCVTVDLSGRAYSRKGQC